MSAKAELFVDCRCELGEGPFWHPMLRRLFWFDILNQTLFSADQDGHLVDRFTFKDVVSAAGVIDRDHRDRAGRRATEIQPHVGQLLSAHATRGGSDGQPPQ